LHKHLVPRILAKATLLTKQPYLKLTIVKTFCCVSWHQPDMDSRYEINPGSKCLTATMPMLFTVDSCCTSSGYLMKVFLAKLGTLCKPFGSI